MEIIRIEINPNKKTSSILKITLGKVGFIKRTPINTAIYAMGNFASGKRDKFIKEEK